jgi:diguanylate cyclase (GGDEF)-like protein/PAS domain S-box-containing protein
MSQPKPRSRYRLHIAEWLGALAMLLALVDVIVHALHPISQLSFAHILFEPDVQAWMHSALALLGILSLFLYQQNRRTALRLIHVKESALRASDARLRSFFEATPDALLISDASGTITMANQQVEALLGYSMEELVGKAIEELVPMRARGGHPKLRDGFAANPAARRMSAGMAVKALRKDGSECDVEISLSRIETDDGQFFASALRDITERKAAEQKINALAFYDQLTGLPNRTLLSDRLRQTITASHRSGICGALLFIDLDHFKTLNDTQGHDVGDMQLKQVAGRLSTCVREGDTVARVGGDEFVVILAGLSESEIEAATHTEAVAAKILATLNQPYQLGEVLHNSSASIGATLFQGTRANIDELMKQADMAMYRAKDAGRNAVRFFDPSMEMVVVKRAALEKDLRNAVAQKQFVLHYQTQVEGGGRVTGAEVLLRWHDPARGMVSPADFIPLAEETGVILALGQWVLNTACHQLESWGRVPGMEHLTLAVNVSALQFAQSDFVQQVMSVVQRTGVNPQRLKLELTESLLVGDVAEIIEKMEALKASGIGFSLDDFGTGYSSLAYLSRLPLDQLKIDKSFVNDVMTNPDDAAIARTIIALAHSLRLGVIAEGVETGISGQRGLPRLPGLFLWSTAAAGGF